MSEDVMEQQNGTKNHVSIQIEFDDNSLLPMLYGEQDDTLNRIEKSLDVTTHWRGNQLAISGEKVNVDTGSQIIKALYQKLQKGEHISPSLINAEIRMTKPKAGKSGKGGVFLEGESSVNIKTYKKLITPYSTKQAEYINALYDNELVFALGPAGTGKTYIAVAMAVNMFMSQRVDRIILSRPAVEAGEKLGFLPGDLKEKIDPYLRPLYDALFDMMPGEKVLRYMETGEIEVAPLAFMRGRTLSNAFVILDEAQNTTATQMKMFLTRLGEGSRMVINGDLSQTDLPRDVKSGLRDALKKVGDIEGIESVKFADADVVRHELAAKIVKAYDDWEAKKRQSNL